jgi:general secretion pathway protein L
MTALRDRVGRLPSAWLPGRLAAGTGGFLSWWGRSLAAWLPVRWRALLGVRRDRLLLANLLFDPGRPGDGLQLRLERDDGVGGPVVEDLATLPALAAFEDEGDPLQGVLAPAVADAPRWLLLPAATGLRRRLTLPAAAAERLRDVVSFEIDRQTPFGADAVAFDARVLGRRAGDNQLDVELVVVPRSALQPHLDALGPLAGQLAGIDLADAGGAPLRINLLAPERRRQRSDPARLWHAALVVAALLAIGLALWQVLANRRAAADAFERSVDARAVDARRASMLRQRLLDAVAGQTYLDQARAGRPSAIEVIDELSRRLPDHTYLEKLAIENDKILLIGLSSDASSLVQRLEGSRLWRAAALAGAVQPDPRSRRDRFTLTADLVIQAPAAPPAQEAADAGDARTR